MSNIAKWITGFTFAVFSMNENVNADGDKYPNCLILQIGENKGLNCSGKSLTKIPRPELMKLSNSADIKLLDISNNKDMQLYDDDFVSKYTDLTVLIMKWLINAKHFSHKLFEPLHSIEHLDMTGMNLKDDSGIIGTILPKSLLVCVLEHCQITKFDLSELKILSSLDIAYNSLNNIPEIMKETPLTQLDMRMNPLNDFQYIDIVPFCLLTHLVLQHPENSELNSSAKYFECCQVEKWIKENDIIGTVSLNCTPLHGQTPECVYQNTSASLLALEERNACLIRHEIIEDDGVHWFYYVISALIAVVSITTMTFVVYKYYEKRRRQRTEYSVTDEN